MEAVHKPDAAPLVTAPGYPRIGESRKLSDRVAAELERRILRGDSKPGERLPTEAELCDLFAVSRSVVRDALRTLVARGLVHVGPRQGIVVAEPNDRAFGEALALLLARSGLTMRQVTEARAAIEVQLSELAATNGTEQDWDEMQAHLDAFEDALAHDELQATHGAHLAFHLALLRAIHLPTLEILLAPMHEIIVMSSVVPYQDRTLWDFDNHPPILAALRRRDAAEVRVALESHFRGFLDDERYAEFEARPFGESLAAYYELGDDTTVPDPLARR